MSCVGPKYKLEKSRNNSYIIVIFDYFNHISIHHTSDSATKAKITVRKQPSLLKRLFGCNIDITKSLSVLDKEAHKNRTPKQYKAKQKVEKSKDYEGGAF